MATVAKSPMPLVEVTKSRKHAANKSAKLRQSYLGSKYRPEFKIIAGRSGKQSGEVTKSWIPVFSRNSGQKRGYVRPRPNMTVDLAPFGRWTLR
jgi:hypothetical protein